MDNGIMHKHRPHYIKDSNNTPRLDPFNFFVNKENIIRKQKAKKILNSISKYNQYTDEELLEASDKLHYRAAGIQAAFASRLEDAKNKGNFNQVRNEIDEVIRDELTADAFALVAAALKKEKGFDFHESQIESALVLAEGNVAEMRCGGGKTIMQFLPAFLNTLTLDHHFIITPNDYLKYEGYIEAKKVFQHLGISVGMMPSDIHKRNEVKQESHKTIVYGTAESIAHSILLDRTEKPENRVIPSSSLSASIDEIDQVVLDNAGSSYVISGEKLLPGTEVFVQGIVKNFTATYKDNVSGFGDLRNDISGSIYDKKTGECLVDVAVDNVTKEVVITERGYEKIDAVMNSNSYFMSLNETDKNLFYGTINNALIANFTMNRDVDYVILDNKVQVYDKVSGRIKTSSSYSKGIQQAIQAKEGLPIECERVEKDGMSVLGLVKYFDKISGCSGTVKELEKYFVERFGQVVREIPAESGNVVNEAPIYFMNKNAKDSYIIDDIIGRKYKKAYMGDNLKYNPDAPLMIVSSSKEEAEKLYEALKKSSLGKDINLITASNSEDEMRIFAQSGKKGAITISTLMAGRGTDVILGGSPSKAALADITDILKKDKRISDEQLFNITAGLDSKDESIFSSTDPKIVEIVSKYNLFLNKYNHEMKGAKEEVNKLGGLCVISTDFINSERSQRQLLSRAGRQTDNGSTVQFVSFEDENVPATTINADKEKIRDMLLNAGYNPETTPITPDLGKIYYECQKIFTSYRKNYDANKSAAILKNDPYEEIVQQQTGYFREMRDYIYTEKDPIDVIVKFMKDGIDKNVSKYMPTNNSKTWDLDGLRDIYGGILFEKNGLQLTDEQKATITPEQMSKLLLSRSCKLVVKNLTVTEEEKQNNITLDQKINNLLSMYFDYFNELISQSRSDADLIKNTASIIRDNSSIDPLVKYAANISNYFDEMLESAQLTFLGEATGTKIEKQEIYKVEPNNNIKKFNESYQQLGKFGYISFKEYHAKKAGISLEEYEKNKIEEMDSVEIEAASRMRSYMLESGNDFCEKLNDKELFDFCVAMMSVDKDDFNKQYNGSRDEINIFVSNSLCEGLRNSGMSVFEASITTKSAVNQFYHFALSNNGLEFIHDELKNVNDAFLAKKNTSNEVSHKSK